MKKLAAVIIAALATSASAAADVPLRDRLCVNVHMAYDETPYWDAAATKAALDYIGTNCLRDGLNLTGWQLDHQTESLLALERPIALISGRWSIGEGVDYARRHNMPVLAFEGVNEPYCHNWPAYDAEQGWIWIRDSQAALAQAAAGDEIYTFSMCTPDWWNLWDPLNVVSGIQNMHPYPPRATDAWPPLGPAETYGTLDWWLANTRYNSSGRYLATEFGSDNADQWWQQQTIVAQWLNHLLRNVERSFVYELVDSGGESFGLYASSYSDKRLAADVLHDWLALVGDATVASTPAPCEIIDPSPNAHHLWLRDGAAWWLAVWTTAPDDGRIVELHCPEGWHEFRRYMPANFGTAMGGSTESTDLAASDTNVFAAWTWDSPSLIRYTP
jgi:hypothetical protein